MSKIKQRIEKLIGAPGGHVLILREDYSESVMRVIKAWDEWRQGLIDRLAKDAKVLYTGDYPGDEYGFSAKNWKTDTHTCLALDFQPIEQAVKKSEIVNVLRGWASPLDMSGDEMKRLADRIEQFGIIND